jgi:hypothetical protein
VRASGRGSSGHPRAPAGAAAPTVNRSPTAMPVFCRMVL